MGSDVLFARTASWHWHIGLVVRMNEAIRRRLPMTEDLA